MLFFLDSSALVKRYVYEAGSERVQFMTDPANGHQIIVARLAWVEVLSALARLRREERITVADETAVRRLFQYDFDTQYQVVDFDQTLAQLAGQLVQRHPLRAYDSIQLASALKLQPTLRQFSAVGLHFVAADKRLLNVAQAEGLAVENPIES